MKNKNVEKNVSLQVDLIIFNYQNLITILLCHINILYYNAYTLLNVK